MNRMTERERKAKNNEKMREIQSFMSILALKLNCVIWSKVYRLVFCQSFPYSSFYFVVYGKDFKIGICRPQRYLWKGSERKKL